MDKEFKQAVCNELKECKNTSEIAKRSFELMQIIADISWEANAVKETDNEAERLAKQ